MVDVSEANIYSALPELSVKNVPIGPLWVSIVTPVPAPALVVLLLPPGLLAALVVPLPPPAFVELPQAATSTAAASRDPVSHAPLINLRMGIVITPGHLPQPTALRVDIYLNSCDGHVPGRLMVHPADGYPGRP